MEGTVRKASKVLREPVREVFSSKEGSIVLMMWWAPRELIRVVRKSLRRADGVARQAQNERGDDRDSIIALLGSSIE